MLMSAMTTYHVSLEIPLGRLKILTQRPNSVALFYYAPKFPQKKWSLLGNSPMLLEKLGGTLTFVFCRLALADN